MNKKKIPQHVVKIGNFKGLDLYVPDEEKELENLEVASTEKVRSAPKLSDLATVEECENITKLKL